jgi:cbb3-type cytochrome oxidase subunit 3
MKIESENAAANFLLGKFTEEENLKIEEGFFSDKNLFEDILIAENDLIDAYVTGGLSPEDKRRFESRLLLNPQQKRRVQFAKTLVNYAAKQRLAAKDITVSSTKPSSASIVSRLVSYKPMLSFAFAAAVLLFFIGGIWFVSERQNSPINQTDELASIQTPEQTPVRETAIEINPDSKITAENKPEISTLSRKSDKRKSPEIKKEIIQKKQTRSIFSIILTPGLTRDSGTSRKFTVPAKTDFVKIQLKFEQGDFISYHAALETIEGSQIWSSKKLKAQKGNVVTVSIPAKLLKKSDYILSLKGVTKEGVYERVEDYAFTINP